MDTEIKKLKKLTKFMQKSGVLSLKTSDYEITLTPQSLFQEEKALTPDSPIQEDPPEFTAEDLLLWSAPGAH